MALEAFFALLNLALRLAIPALTEKIALSPDMRLRASTVQRRYRRIFGRLHASARAGSLWSRVLFTNRHPPFFRSAL
jgi:hypothetical protein